MANIEGYITPEYMIISKVYDVIKFYETMANLEECSTSE